MTQLIYFKFFIQNNKIHLDKSIYQLNDFIKTESTDGTTQIRIGNMIRGFLEINFSHNLISITTDEFSTLPLYYHFSSNILSISNNLDHIHDTFNNDLQYNESDISNFIQSGYFFNSTGFNNIHITKLNINTKFIPAFDKFIISNQNTQSQAVVFENYSFQQLYDDLVQSTEFLLKSSEYQTVDLTGGVDTRLILGILFELGYEKKYTFVTDKADVNDRKYDFEIASQICEKYKLKHQDKSQTFSAESDQMKCLSGKYGSEFFSGEFPNFWGEYQANDRKTHYPNLPYLDHHISPLNDLYFIYGTRSFIDSVSNLYNINNTPYKLRNSLLGLNKIPLESQKSYAFHNYIFNDKLNWLSSFPFFSNFSNFNSNFNFLKKGISPKDSNTYQVDDVFAIELLKDHSHSIINDSKLSLFDKKIRLARVKLLNEYFKKFIS